MSFSLTEPSPQEPTVHLPTRAQMYAKIAADCGLAPAARKAHEDALRARFDAEIEAARFNGVRGLAPAARLGLGGFGGSELGDDDGPGILDLLNEPALPSPREPFRGTYKTARDLAFTEFPVSEAVILAAARKLGIGRKFGRTILFSPADRQRLYEDSPCLSDSSAAPSRPTGTSAAPSAASALKRARKLLTTDERSAKGAP